MEASGNPACLKALVDARDRQGGRVEHITGRLFRNDAVVDAVPFVYGVPVVAGSASRVGLDRACVATLRNTRYARDSHVIEQSDS